MQAEPVYLAYEADQKKDQAERKPGRGRDRDRRAGRSRTIGRKTGDW